MSEFEPLSVFDLDPKIKPFLVDQTAQAFKTPDNLFKRTKGSTLRACGLLTLTGGLLLAGFLDRSSDVNAALVEGSNSGSYTFPDGSRRWETNNLISGIPPVNDPDKSYGTIIEYINGQPVRKIQLRGSEYSSIRRSVIAAVDAAQDSSGNWVAFLLDGEVDNQDNFYPRGGVRVPVTGAEDFDTHSRLPEQGIPQGTYSSVPNPVGKPVIEDATQRYLEVPYPDKRIRINLDSTLNASGSWNEVQPTPTATLTPIPPTFTPTPTPTTFEEPLCKELIVTIKSPQPGPQQRRKVPAQAISWYKPNCAPTLPNGKPDKSVKFQFNFNYGVGGTTSDESTKYGKPGKNVKEIYTYDSAGSFRLRVDVNDGRNQSGFAEISVVPPLDGKSFHLPSKPEATQQPFRPKPNLTPTPTPTQSRRR